MNLLTNQLSTPQITSTINTVELPVNAIFSTKSMPKEGQIDEHKLLQKFKKTFSFLRLEKI
uniref:Uncharacterized protein n=1 Tax=Arundo donax TaxID=35708 RepID=A0A0A8YCB3_ARUDO